MTLLSLFLLAPSLAQPKGVKVEVLKKERSATANREADLLHFKVRLINNSKKALPYTNNRFVLKDDQDQVYLVSRGWYPQGKLLKPGDSVELDRVYFEIPKKAKAKELVLMWRRVPLGSAKL